jgi:predicted N-acyltransferase
MTPRGDRIEVRHDLDDLEPTGWDALQHPRGFYASMPWLRHAHATADPPPWYVIATDQDGLLAGMPVYPLGVESPYVFCRTDEVVAGLLGNNDNGSSSGGDGDGDGGDAAATWTGDLMPTLSCGGRNPAHTRVGVRAGVDPDRRAAILGAMIRTAEREAHAAGLRSVSFLYVDEDDAVLRATLRQAAYVELPSEPAYALDVPVDDPMAGYLARFRHGRRHAILRERRAVRAAGVVYETGPLTDELADRIAPLELALYRRHGTRADAGAFAAVLHSIARHCGDVAQVVTAHLAGQLAGFVLVFGYGGEMYARQTGFDTDLTGRLPLYFDLVYYELVRLAGEQRLGRIYYSTGSGDVKESRGCYPIEQFAYVKCFDPAVHEKLANLVG